MQKLEACGGEKRFWTWDTEADNIWLLILAKRQTLVKRQAVKLSFPSFSPIYLS
ncbi:hypothetical protein MC7420_4347 [Coleofasciculus chthonoplastes PCC 7420]|uniref:Uncharacterized protein n=1 Tax=Coleofasciculus chthonoplastes PCC 7420 TaxID=118168 RepID=B4VXT0_9CYAN|nr:hypothetical protein MC7420_4347 [Coleofasciculus chthonoplastes PCC 7420]